MFEKRFASVAAQTFTANGGVNGSVTINEPHLFKVKQKVILAASGQSNLELEIKKITSTLFVGPVGGSISAFTDVSAYTLAAGATISANEQLRPIISVADIERATYEEEPVVAKRVVMVDKQGNVFDDDNPLPATFTGSVNVGEVDQGDPATNAEAWPVKVTDGTDLLSITAAGEAIVSVTQPLPAGSNNIGIVDANIKPLSAATSAQYTVGEEAVQVDDDTLVGRKSISIKFFGSGEQAYVGFSDSVDNSTGYLLNSGDSISLDLDESVQVWVIATADAQTVYTIQIA